ncbi:MAG: hypothetical protein QG658_581 [Patescibacteria group bacterium]|jgi:hypothetical protein|nr:hypothetical protein [Patescibacteria group bacterium]
MYDYPTTTTTAVYDPVTSIFWLAFVVLLVVALWKVFTKAGKPGWASIVPIYNTYIMLKIAGRPGWWLLLMLIPLVNIVVYLIVSIDIAKAFGKSSLFGVVGLFFFSAIGYLMLGFGKAVYQGAVASPAVAPPPAPPAAK